MQRNTAATGGTEEAPVKATCSTYRVKSRSVRERSQEKGPQEGITIAFKVRVSSSSAISPQIRVRVYFQDKY
jgi:hypothetical protein